MASAVKEARPALVEAELVYHAKCDHRPQMFLGGPDPSPDAGIERRIKVPIHNLRYENPHYDVEGFALFPHKTRLTDIRDRDFLENDYSRELERAVLDITGCRKAVITKVIAPRLTSKAKDFLRPGTTFPAPAVHDDYNKKTGPAAMAPYLTEDELANHRYAVFSLWRAVSDPPQDNTVCLCDARTVIEEDRQYLDFYMGEGPIESRHKMEGNGYLHSPRHRWGYYPDMRRDELLFIKTYDSDDSKSWRVAHSSFEDPTAGPDAVPRESVDIRGIAIW